MKSLLLVLLAFSVVAAAQTRSDTFDGTKTVITEVILHPLPDGGCAASWGATVTSEDGGASISTVTASVNLTKNAARNDCSDLVEAGSNRVRKALRLADDGGEP